MIELLNGFLNVYNYIKPVLSIGVLAFLLYKMYELVSRTNGIQLLRAASVIAIAYAIVWILKLDTLLWIFNLVAPGLVIGLVVVFQPEIRKLFLKLGQFSFLQNKKGKDSIPFDKVLIAAEQLGKMRRGMLVVFLRQTKHEDFLAQDNAVHLNADLSPELLVSIYSHDTPMHDGACFVDGKKVLAAGIFLPSSEQYDIRKTFGSRHRAALGMAETSDSIVLIVSEETGAISLAYDSKIHYDLTMDQLTYILDKELDFSRGNKKKEKDDVKEKENEQN